MFTFFVIIKRTGNNQKNLNMELKKTILIIILLISIQLSGRTQNSFIPGTSVSFKTNNIALQRLFDEAEKQAKLNIKQFGKYRVLVEGGGYNNVWLETQPMGGYMYAKRNIEIARNNVQIFMDFQREDGRLPGMISLNNNALQPHYAWFQGFCFPMPAWELYFWLNKDKEYLKQLYSVLEQFDAFLWKNRDSDGNGCLETWCVYDTGEDNCSRLGQAPNAWPYDYPPTKEQVMRMTEKEWRNICHKPRFDFTKGFPVPIESMDIMSYSYAGRNVLALISKELQNGREAHWKNKADDVRKKIKNYLWIKEKYACYDKDKSNNTMDILLHNNLRCMYWGSFDQQMADDFIKYHLMNPDEFWTKMPLPSIAVNDSFFRNNPINNWSGQPEGLTYQRSIRALENYGHYAELTMLGLKFLKAVGDSLQFTQQFDPFKGNVVTATKNKAYGPSILTSLEFIGRLYGIHLTQNKIYWSCLDTGNEIDYSQKVGDDLFQLKTEGKQVKCAINGVEVFSFTKGIRVVSDFFGEIIKICGIETEIKKGTITCNKKTIQFEVTPNSEYNKNMELIREIPFFAPLESN